MLKNSEILEIATFSYAYLAVPVGMIFLNFIILPHLYQLYRMHVINESKGSDLGQKTSRNFPDNVFANKKNTGLQCAMFFDFV